MLLENYLQRLFHNSNSSAYGAFFLSSMNLGFFLHLHYKSLLLNVNFIYDALKKFTAVILDIREFIFTLVI